MVMFFTPEKGRLKGVAKSGRKSRTRFINCFDSFSCVELEIGFKKGRDIHFLHSGKLINALPGLRSDFTNLSRASYMVELTEHLFPWGVAEERMFGLLKDAFRLLEQGELAERIPIFFEAKAMTIGGFGINLGECCGCGRDYRGEGRAVFKREKGAIACMKCHQESALSPCLSPESVNLIKRIQSEPISKLIEITLTEEMIREIKPVFKLHREYRLEKRLRTSKYVE